MGIRKTFKHVSLVVILGLSTWALWPPRQGDGDGSGGQTDQPRRDVKYDLRVDCGQLYKPGTSPMGLGDPVHGYRHVINAFEKRYPDTRITLVTVPARREYLVTQLSSGLAPDIVNVNVEDVWIDVQKGWYVALDPYLEAPNPFVEPGQPGESAWWDLFKYQAISRGKAAPDGKMYNITFDMIETAIYYNKQIFKEVGLDVPTDWEAFERVMTTLKKTKYVPIQTSLFIYCDWALDLFLDQLYHSTLPGIDLDQDPKREQYLAGYLDWHEICFLFTKGFFTRRDPRYVKLFELLRRFRKFANKDIMTADIHRGFVREDAAMVWLSSLTSYRLDADKQLGFDWGVFYLPQFTRKTTAFASNTPMCVIGGAGTQYEVTNSAFGDTGDPATSERLKRVIAFLQFVTVPENYEQIVNERPIWLPNIVGVPVRPLLEPFDRILARRYTTTKWTFTFDLRFSDILHRTLALYLDDGISLDEFLEWQEGNLRAAYSSYKRRKNADWDALEREWQRLAPVRATMKGLPKPE